MKSEISPQPVLLKDYRAPEFLVDAVNLEFDLHASYTNVRNFLRLRPNSADREAAAHVKLDGDNLKLQRVVVAGKELAPNEYDLSDKQLVFKTPTLASPNEGTSSFDVEIWTQIEPHKNLAFTGLFQSGGNLLTQCEPEGFRRITFYPDRPDVMATYTVRVEADKAKYPVLLSNGNLVEKKEIGSGRHFAIWHDPFPKPSYLFALVAGDFGKLEDQFTTRSGRQVKLEIYSKQGHEERCRWAMTSLKDAMTWDEQTYGLEYDLDIYMIVVSDDFNGGAMENKGLNIFNSAFVLANPQTATDMDYHGIQAVVGHEYFHNWTGNRVTCRDWFQLSLKEGLTVFRDQEFSADMTSKAVRRIEEVIKLRTEQFSEDAGPMAHPIRPSSYIEINNFYTRTVYEKGAEVIRMIQAILGRENYLRGIRKYFELFDGQAVRTEDFVHAMELASGIDLTQFKTWYDQAGTPVVKVENSYDQLAKTLTLKLSQSCPATPGQNEKKPFHIPVAVGLLGTNGLELPLNLTDESSATGTEGSTTRVLQFRKTAEEFVFTNVPSRPVVSLLRGFSAPVRLDQDVQSRDLSFQHAHDSDAFCRWEAGQKLVTRAVMALVGESGGGPKTPENSSMLLDELSYAYQAALKNEQLDPALKALLLEPPAETYLAQFFTVVHPTLIHEARERVLVTLAKANEDWLHTTFTKLDRSKANGNNAQAAGERALRNECLLLLQQLGHQHLSLAVDSFRTATNMTDELGALNAMNRTASTERATAMQAFYKKWKDESLVINKWLQLEATAPLPQTLARIRELTEDPVFDETNPNKVTSLFYRFGMLNPICFHHPSGDAYAFIADRILSIDSRNPQVAARLASLFNPWRRYESGAQVLMKKHLERMLTKQGLSKNVFEIVTKALA